MASIEENLFSALIRKRPNTQPLHARSSARSSLPVLPDTPCNVTGATPQANSDSARSRSTSIAPEEDNEPTAISEEGEKSTAVPSRLASPSVEEPPFAPSQYRMQTILKRKFSEDMTNFAEDQVRLNSLQGLDADDIVRRFAHYSVDQKLIALYASCKKQRLDIERMYKAASGPWQPSNALFNKIRKFCFLVLVNPAISKYTGEKPGQQVMDILVKYPRMGFTSEMAADMDKQNVVMKVISDQLTVVRSEFKTIIQKFTLDETGHQQKDINSLCRAIVTAKSKLAPKLEPTINIAARFAFLRAVFLINSGHRYWNKVDSQLELIRVKFTKDEVSAYFGANLDDDREKYPLLLDDITTPELPFSQFTAEDHVDESDGVDACF